ncbi:MAG: 50S ribosomal protein L13 [Thermotogae bacterium]|nr:50S ribosomal protein L13 [Thermotogota bacterium]MCP5465719.1 50S ribosomal protein L13 [Thermotogota bacterium]HOO75265.1 50S ribosomal protein L13 [Tepiditoga sp.]
MAYKMTQKSYTAKPQDIDRKWYVVDAEGISLGRLSSQIARILQGKNKPTYTPHIDTGDFIIVVNADKVNLSGNKLTQKVYYRHTNYPGGLKETLAKDMLEKHPERVIKHAVKGMLPKSILGKQMLSKLKIYAGPAHPHDAQKPEKITLVK